MTFVSIAGHLLPSITLIECALLQNLHSVALNRSNETQALLEVPNQLFKEILSIYFLENNPREILPILVFIESIVL